ncbi:hypothetical protein SAMN04487843_11692 [Methylobacterium sp. ap11]|nr:hypothetical protein SAMN04487843_11692 [Methylobacterium sp. ap11]
MRSCAMGAKVRASCPSDIADSGRVVFTSEGYASRIESTLGQSYLFDEFARS